MNELTLKYGCNPNQKPARIYMEAGDLPVTVRCGNPGYINFLDALNGWQLVRELDGATGLPAAASFKHVSPAGAAVGQPLPDALRRACFIPEDEALSPLACAYARARGADRMSSFGDFAALSRVCDVQTAKLLAREVSDGVIAPGYAPEALEILTKKRKGAYNVIEIDPRYVPAPIERKTVFGVTFEQGRNDVHLDETCLRELVTANKDLPESAKRDLLIALIALKYTQSNSVCYAYDGQTVGVGAGQQSRIHCTRLAGDKTDKWFLRQHPAILALPFRDGFTRPERDNTVDVCLSEHPEEAVGEAVWAQYFTARPTLPTEDEKRAYLDAVSGVALGSDAFFPFGDNIERARRSGVAYIAQPGGSIRDDNVIAACDRHGIAMAFTHIRLFHH